MISERAKKRIQDYYADPKEAETRKFFDWAAKQRFSKELRSSRSNRGRR